MSELSGSGAGFNRSVNSPSTQTTRIQAQQSQVQQRQTLSNFGTPATADAFSRTVRENTAAMGTIPTDNPFKNPLSDKLYASKKAPAQSSNNPFAQETGGLFSSNQIDWNARQQFAENMDSHASAV